MNEKEWIRGQLLELMERAQADKLWLVLVFARTLIK